MNALSEEVKNDERVIKEEKERFQSGRVRSKELELQIEDKKNHIARYQEQIFKVKTNKEYTALLHEIEKIKADISALEDRMLELMEEVEDEQAKLGEAQSGLDLARKRFGERERTAREDLQAIDRELEKRRGEREDRTAGIDPDLYERYEIIFTRKPDRALVVVRDNACGGCNMELTAQMLNDLARAEGICQCENCGRFIYLDE
ncbi:MAG: C4-type zinc ribbon domain-containing protein [PVC group bacterium]